MAGTILTQAEIDKLIGDALSGASLELTTDKGKIKNYDFLNPSKVNKEQLRTISLIFEHYARLINNYISLNLRSSCDIKIVGTEQLNFNEFYNSIGNISIIGTIEARPLKTFMIYMSTELGDIFIDKMLGGSGKPIRRTKDFSEIEITLLNKVFTKFSELLVEPFSNIIELKPEFIKIETSKQFMNFLGKNEQVIILTLEVNINSYTGFIQFCVPYTSIESIMNKLNTNYQYSLNKELTTDSRELIENKINNIKIPITTLLFETNISIKDFRELSVGDVIVSDTYKDDKSPVFIGNILKFNGNPGIFNHHNSVRINQVIKE